VHETQNGAQRWAIMADFFTSPEATWLDDYITDARFELFKVLPVSSATNWHIQKLRTTSLSRWLNLIRYARKAFATAPDGIITCFPQLAMCAALVKRCSRHKPSIVAYNYNLGGFPGGVKKKLARFVASQIDRFVVHSPSEVDEYSAYLGVSVDRVQFVPLQRGEIRMERIEDISTPFLLSMGSAHRDYETLLNAVKGSDIPVTIVTRASDVDTLPKQENVTYLSNLTDEECLELLARSRLSVTPISNLQTASGQVTFINAMRLGVAVIATRCPGTEGYIEDGHTGLLVAPRDVEGLRSQILRLWRDDAAREGFAKAGQQAAAESFTDEVAAARLVQMLEDVCVEKGKPTPSPPHVQEDAP
jgi:glycosyltransferase involved in cell wall biosynthesis